MSAHDRHAPARSVGYARIRVAPRTLVRALLTTIGALPWLGALLETGTSFPQLRVAVFAAFALQCHQNAARALPWVEGLPVCARCSGVYLGLVIAGLMPLPQIRKSPLVAVSALAATALLVDVATEWVLLRPPAATLRLMTGLVVGVAAGWLIVRGARPACTDPRRGELEAGSPPR